MEEKVIDLEVTVGKLVSSVQGLAESVSIIAEKTDTLTRHVAHLEAGQGKIPTATIFATVSMILGIFALVLALTITPIQRELQTTTAFVPKLTTDMSDLQARVRRNEQDIDRLIYHPKMGAVTVSAELEKIKDLNIWTLEDQKTYIEEQRRYDDLLKERVEP